MKVALSLDELREIALAKIREHRGCHDVEDLSVCPIDNSEHNWAVSCGVGGSDKVAASKAALYVQDEMRRSYELLADQAEQRSVARPTSGVPPRIMTSAANGGPSPLMVPT